MHEKEYQERVQSIRRMKTAATYALRNGFISDAVRLQKSATTEEMSLFQARANRMEAALHVLA
jgi:hypothetical protein